MRILISGSSGLIGTVLIESLQSEEDRVFQLVRNQSNLKENQIFWDPANLKIDASQLENFDAVIHLAGVNIAEKRWTEAFKKEIISSRISSTSLLAKTISSLNNPPKVFICASAIGIYGDRADQILNEETPSGSGFLADLAKAWEGATRPAKDAGIRVVNTRTGLVLSKKAGALPKMLTPFKLGLGGRLGNGKHYMSWITLEDTVNAIIYIIKNPSIEGPVNLVAPTPVSNSEFTASLAKAIHRPAIFPAPRSVLRILFGEIVDGALFVSQRVVPQKLLDSGFSFKHPEISQALTKLLTK